MGVAVEDRPFLTIPEVAVLHDVSRERAYALATDDVIPAIRLSPRRIRVPREAFDEWLSDQARQAMKNVKTDQDRDGPP